MDNNFESFTIDISSWTKAGRWVIFLNTALKLLNSGPMFRLAIPLAYAIFCFFGYNAFSVISGKGYVSEVLSFIVSNFVFFLLWRTIADKYFNRFKTKYMVSVRDSLIQLSFAGIIGFALIPYGLAVSLGMFLAALMAGMPLYNRFFGSKKLPDMQIVQDIKSDVGTIGALDIDGGDSITLRKIQLNNELRDSVAIKSGGSFRVKISDRDSVLTLGAAMKDISAKGGRLSIEGIYNNGAKKVLFNKNINPVKYFRDRTWNDTLIDLSNNEKNERLHEAVYSFESSVDNNIYISLPIKPRVTINPPKNNIYVFVIDSLRKDYFDGADTLIEKGFNHSAGLINDSKIYANAYTQGAWTLPTLGSFLSGLYASYHDQSHPGLQKEMNRGIPLLPEKLKEKGYFTYGFGAGPRTTPNYGYSRGFDRYYYRIADKSLNLATADRAYLWMLENDRKYNGKSGEFYYIHLLEAHTPYYPPRDFEWCLNKISMTDVLRDVKSYRKIKGALDFTGDKLKFFKDLYRSELDFCMYWIDNFIGYLKSKKLYDESLIVIMGDHGNNFGEHRPIATVDLYREYVEVGLSVKYPLSMGIKGGHDARFVNANIDTASTILKIAGVDDKSLKNGKDISATRYYADDPLKEVIGDFAISEDLYVSRYYISIRNNEFTFIYRTDFDGKSFKNFKRENERFELYDRANDPCEERNIFDKAGRETKDMFFRALNIHVNGALRYHGVNSRILVGEKV